MSAPYSRRPRGTSPRRVHRAGAARSLPGSGLGLAMARQIARAHGADLTAESLHDADGGGSCFRLTGLAVLAT